MLCYVMLCNAMQCNVSNKHCIASNLLRELLGKTLVLRCLSTVFSGPYQTFSFGRLANFTATKDKLNAHFGVISK